VLRDRKLLIGCGAVMFVVFAGFMVSPAIHIQPSLVALLGAGVLILVMIGIALRSGYSISFCDFTR
jgi:Na+/H+ antiporter NhaD/arsenite permease-like protein